MVWLMTTPPTDYIAEALNNGRSTIDSLRQQYGVQPNETIPAAIARQNERNWRDTEAALCNDVASQVKAGASPEKAFEAMLERAGFAAGTKLSCSAVTADNAPRHGVTIDASARSTNQGIDY